MNKIIRTTNIIILALLLFTIGSVSVYAKESKKPRVESVINPELIQKTVTTFSAAQAPVVTDTQTETLGPNLIQNPTFDIAGPANWSKGGYGANSRTFTYPVPGNTDAKAAKVTVTNYSGGDAKWFFDNISIKPNTTYTFSDYSLSSTQSILTIRYTLTDGTFIYKDTAFISPSSTFSKNTVRFTTPPNATSLTIFHLINSNGTLTVDDYSLNLVTQNTTNNLVSNGDFEVAGADGLPTGWNRGGWGGNTRTFGYPILGVTNSKSANVGVSNYINGDAKWYFKPIPVTPGIYTYSDQTLSNVPSTITIQFNNIDGSTTYKDLLKIPATTELTASSVDFSVGAEVATITIFHLIQTNGTLNIDNVSVIKKSDPVGIFKTGAVTFRFDDGWLSQLENAVPKLNSVGFKGTFYIVSRQKADDGFPAFMSTSQIRQLYISGHEIGAHTQTHPYLSTLSSTDQETEIAGSRIDLLALNIGPVVSFAYPYGDYNTTSLSIVKNAGFTNAISTIDGYGTQTSDKYQIERKSATASTTLATLKQWVDDAQANKKWLILTFHEVNDNGSLYSISPQIFNPLVDYVVNKNVPVVTVTEGSKSIQN